MDRDLLGNKNKLYFIPRTNNRHLNVLHKSIQSEIAPTDQQIEDVLRVEEEQKFPKVKKEDLVKPT